MMRVLMISAGYPPSVGGGERQCKKLSVALVENGAAVRVVTRGIPGEATLSTNEGVEVHRSYHLASGPRWLQRGVNAAAFLTLVAASLWRARRGAADVVHQHGLDLPLVLARLLLFKSAVPLEATPWCAGEDRDVSSSSPSLLQWSLGGVDGFQAMAPQIVDELSDSGVPQSKIHLIPGIVEIPPTLTTAEADPPEVLFGARFVPQKRPDVMVDAWHLTSARRNGAQLIMAGAGPLLDETRERAASLGLEDSVSFPGTPPDWSERLARCALFVIPSRAEGMSQAMLEAMSLGRACVVSDLPVNHYLFKDTAVYTPVGDPEALARALDELLASEQERARLGQAARRRAEAQFDIRQVVQRHRSLYQQLIDGREAA